MCSAKSYKKIAILGPPGSGKSTFAMKLGKKQQIPVHHLDRHMFEESGKKKDKQEFIEIQKAMLREESWVVEGCSFSTWGMRFAKADLILYFDFNRPLCIWRLCKRFFDYRKEFGGLRAITWEILRYTWKFHKEKKPHLQELQRQHPDTELRIFINQKEADRFLSSFASEGIPRS